MKYKMVYKVNTNELFWKWSEKLRGNCLSNLIIWVIYQSKEEAYGIENVVVTLKRALGDIFSLLVPRVYLYDIFDVHTHCIMIILNIFVLKSWFLHMSKATALKSWKNPSYSVYSIFMLCSYVSLWQNGNWHMHNNIKKKTIIWLMTYTLLAAWPIASTSCADIRKVKMLTWSKACHSV